MTLWSSAERLSASEPGVRGFESRGDLKKMISVYRTIH